MTLPPEPRRAASTRSSTRPRPPDPMQDRAPACQVLKPRARRSRSAVVRLENGGKDRPDFLDRFLSASPLLAVYLGLAALLA